MVVVWPLVDGGCVSVVVVTPLVEGGAVSVVEVTALVAACEFGGGATIGLESPLVVDGKTVVVTVRTPLASDEMLPDNVAFEVFAPATVVTVTVVVEIGP